MGWMTTDSEKLILYKLGSRSRSRYEPKKSHNPAQISFPYSPKDRVAGQVMEVFLDKIKSIKNTHQHVNAKSDKVFFFRFLLSPSLLFMFRLKKEKKAIFIQKHFKSFSL